MNNKRIQEIRERKESILAMPGSTYEQLKGDITYLLSEVERLQEENKTMKEALEQIDGASMSQFANLEDMVKGIKLISRKAISHLKGE